MENKYLDKLNSRFAGVARREQAAKEREEKKKENATQSAVNTMFAEGTNLEVVFESADAEGSLFLVDKNGITFMLDVDVIKQALPYYTSNLKTTFLGKQMNCVVSNYDADTKTVVLALKNDDAKSRKKQIFSIISKELANKAAGKKLVLFGRVERVYDNRADIDLLGQGIRGVIYCTAWSKTFVRSLRDVCQVDDILEFEVMSVKTKQKDNTKVFVLSRVDLTPDPWENFPDYLEIGSQLSVKCVQVPENKTYWWGSSASVPGIEIMCNFNKKAAIKEGNTYLCSIKRLDIEKHDFLCVPLKQLNSTSIGSVQIAKSPQNKKDIVFKNGKKSNETKVQEKSEVSEVNEAKMEPLVKDEPKEKPATKEKTETKKTVKHVKKKESADTAKE